MSNLLKNLITKLPTTPDGALWRALYQALVDASPDARAEHGPRLEEALAGWPDRARTAKVGSQIRGARTAYTDAFGDLDSLRWNQGEPHPIAPYVRSLAFFLSGADAVAPFDAADRLDGKDSGPLTHLTVVVQNGVGLSSPLTQRLAESAHLSGLRSLTLETGVFDQPLVKMLHAQPGLTELRCVHVHQSDPHFVTLLEDPRAAQFETLHLGGVEDILVTLADASHLDRLRCLEVPNSGGHRSVERTFWRRLAKASCIRRLERLDISGCFLEDHCLSAFLEAAPLSEIRSLDLRNNRLTEASHSLLRDGPLPPECEVLWDGPSLGALD